MHIHLRSIYTCVHRLKFILDNIRLTLGREMKFCDLECSVCDFTSALKMFSALVVFRSHCQIFRSGVHNLCQRLTLGPGRWLYQCLLCKQEDRDQSPEPMGKVRGDDTGVISVMMTRWGRRKQVDPCTSLARYPRLVSEISGQTKGERNLGCDTQSGSLTSTCI